MSAIPGLSVIITHQIECRVFHDRFEPLDHDATERLSIELCGICCSACYPSEDDDEIHHQYHARNTYQSPTPTMAVSARWGGGETIV